MTEECELLETCGFFKKYGLTKDLACRGFIRMYCRGPRMGECLRKQFRLEHGTPPPDDMMPSGRAIVANFGLRTPDAPDTTVADPK